jgi:hypothetical protein
MRTMVITRYAFGYWGAAIVSLLNILTQVRIHCLFHTGCSPDAFVHNSRFFSPIQRIPLFQPSIFLSDGAGSLVSL